MKKILMGIMAMGLIFSHVFPAQAQEKAQSMPFIVYLDEGKDNHYTPTGYMGDVGDLTLEESGNKPYQGKTCLKWHYAAKGSHTQGWAGCYWQEPTNNWGEKDGGYNLSKANKLVFWAKGEKGGEIISFLIGGILSGRVSRDTCAAKIDDVRLTKDWKEYVIDLNGKDIKNIITGFGFVITSGKNPVGCTFYLDKISYVE